MIRVYQFILDHRVGGPHVYVDTLRKALTGKVESIIVTTGRGPMTDVALVNLRHLWAPLYALEMILNVIYLIAAVLLGRVKRRDVVFDVHGSANLAPILAARIVGIPVVWHFHETTLRFRRLVAIGRWLLNGHPHALVVVANKIKVAYGLENTEFIPAAVDTTFWSREKVSDEDIKSCGWITTVGRCGHPLKLLAVGNLNPLKGMDILLEAMAEIDGPWHLKIVGAKLSTHDEYADRLYQRADEITSLKKGCIVDFHGWQENTQVRSLLASCDIFVLPSRSEACPIALLEAMTMGCACVVADVGDVSLMLENYPGSRLFPVESVDDLTSCIKAMQIDDTTSHRVRGSNDSVYRLEATSAKALLIYKRLTTNGIKFAPQ